MLKTKDRVSKGKIFFDGFNKKVLHYILDKEKVSLKTITTNFNCNEGYLNVGLRILCSQGWLNQEIDNETNQISYSTNQNSSRAIELIPIYEDAVKFLPYSVKFPEERIGPDAFSVLERIFKKYEIIITEIRN